MPLFSEEFGLQKQQYELDFVDIPVNADIPLFIDPFALSHRPERWSQEAHRTLVHLFDRIVHAIRRNDDAAATRLLGRLSEPNETHFGYSRGRPQGAGIGRFQAQQLLDALKDSTAVQTGFLNSLEEAELMVDGISWDKTSDLTTNVIRAQLVAYTQEQCELHDVPLRSCPLPPFYDSGTASWQSDYFDLPTVRDQPLVLVPKVIARYNPAYDHGQYYQHFVLNHLQAEHLSSGSALVHTFKNGRRTVFKKDLKRVFPLTKENLYEFSRNNPSVLEDYRERLEELEVSLDSEVDQGDERVLAEALSTALGEIPTGGKDASAYHDLMIGMVEFIFFPSLLMPQKEREIHEGRKRIDILMENGARRGILQRLHSIRGLPCSFVALECKNYGREVGNPELDQLAGRFSPNRGRFGILLCRSFEDRARFIARCQDTFRDDRGLIIPVDDDTLREWLGRIADGRRSEIDQLIGELIDEVWLA